MTSLVPCPDCSRHVFATAAQCPFCAALLPTDLEARAIPGATQRLSRAAIYAFTASLSVAACSSGGPTDLGGDSGSSDSAARPDTGGCCPPYGQPADAGIGPVYGQPIDASDDTPDSGAGGVLYGLPPPDAGTD